jgi:hypothetical protein
MSERQSILEKISIAKRDLSETEIDLEKVIGEILVSPRAEKTTISKVVEDALAKLRAARANLDELEKFVEIGLKQ